jgi:hypothetical protein
MSMMRFHPVVPRPTGFGFDEIMARPFENRFRRWYDATSLLPALPAEAAVDPDAAAFHAWHDTRSAA